MQEQNGVVPVIWQGATTTSGLTLPSTGAVELTITVPLNWKRSEGSSMIIRRQRVSFKLMKTIRTPKIIALLLAGCCLHWKIEKLYQTIN